MTAGGFMFAKTSIKYDSTTYPTKRAWGLAVHKARCEAFLRATARGGSAWGSIQTNLYNEFAASVPTGTSSTATVRIQDVHPVSVDTNSEYPAFVSYFRATDENSLGHTPEYMIITAFRFNYNASNKSTISNGMYINSDRMQRYLQNPNTFIVTGHSCMQSYAANGFHSYDHEQSSMDSGEFYIMPHVGGSGIQVSAVSASTASNSLVSNPLTTDTYYFGFAVKGSVIESFYKTSSYTPSGQWMFSVVGDIYGDDCAGADWPYGTFGSRTENFTDKSVLNDTTTWYWNSHYYGVCQQVLDKDGHAYPSKTEISTSKMNEYCISPAFYPVVGNSTLGDEIIYSALCFGYTLPDSATSATCTGIDDTKTLTKGFINTDVARCVNKFVSRNGGATLQSGNFLAIYCGYSRVGLIIGWDPSNESIV